MGGTEKRGKPDCGFNSTQICCGPLRSRPQTALQLREMKEVQPYPHQSGSLKEGELGACTEEVPEMGPYRSGVSKSWRPPKTPSHPTRPNCKVSGPTKHIPSLPRSTHPARRPRTVQTLKPWGIPYWDSTQPPTSPP